MKAPMLKSIRGVANRSLEGQGILSALATVQIHLDSLLDNGD